MEKIYCWKSDANKTWNFCCNTMWCRSKQLKLYIKYWTDFLLRKPEIFLYSLSQQASSSSLCFTVLMRWWYISELGDNSILIMRVAQSYQYPWISTKHKYKLKKKLMESYGLNSFRHFWCHKCACVNQGLNLSNLESSSAWRCLHCGFFEYYE